MGLQAETETIGNEIWRPIAQEIEHTIYYYIKYVRYYDEYFIPRIVMRCLEDVSCLNIINFVSVGYNRSCLSITGLFWFCS